MSNGQETLDILGVPISRLSMTEALDACERRARSGAGGYVCFVNAHSLTESGILPEVRQALSGATYAVADGVPLVWASRLKARAIGSRVCGPDFMADFLERTRDLRHGFVGGAPGQGEALIERFGLKSARSFSPPYRPFAPAAVRQDIDALARACGPEGRLPPVVWVGLGAPKQELWMHEAACLASGTLFFGVGAAFDFLTGTKERAPEWMRRAGMEWLFRLSQEPGRLLTRYVVGNTRFVARVGVEILRERFRSPRRRG